MCIQSSDPGYSKALIGRAWHYHGVQLELGYRLDLVVEDVVVEIKTVTKLLPVHDAQLLSYLRLSNRRVGLLINFHEARFRDGIKRIVN